MKSIYFCVVLLASSAPEVQHRHCDHAAPPAGMHYVCVPADSCNCHLERDQPADDQVERASGASAAPCGASGVKYFVVPSYPTEARQAGKQGLVQAQVLVGPSGIENVKIESGEHLFAHPVSEALKNWKFASSDSARIYAISIQFRLLGNASADQDSRVSGASPLELLITAHPPLR